jgi:tRNA pseudouridine38-40 synthase
MRIALGLEFAGSSFTGMAIAARRSWRPGRARAAVEAIAGARIGTVAAGRTDAGVHATMQVVHFDSPVART